MRRRAFAHLTRGRRELLLFLAAYCVYDGARWIAKGDAVAAQAHAHWIADVERSAGVGIERAVQQGLGTGVWSELLSNVYLAAQLAVLPCALVWLYRSTPVVYRHLRNTILATWLIAIPIFAAYPVAPPRLADPDMVDSVSRQAAFALTGHSTVFYNPLAAVPSLHVGFAFAIGVAVAASLRSWWIKPLALLWGPVVTLAVIATGNHFVFDALAGLAVTALGFAAGELVASRSSAGRELELGDRGSDLTRWNRLPCQHEYCDS
jgi:PAP2 superfamily